jgi:hypothetical protein
MHVTSGNAPARWTLFFCAAALIAFLAWSAHAAPGVQAAPPREHAGTPLPGPDRPTWVNPFAPHWSRYAPQGLLQTARFFGPGGEPVNDACAGLHTSSDAPAYGVIPADSRLHLDHSWHSRTIIVERCDGRALSRSQITLTAPDGAIVGPEGFGANQAHFLLREDSPAGVYELALQTDEGPITRQIEVSRAQPRLELRDDTGAAIARVAPCRTVDVRYTGFAANTTVEAGLYREDRLPEGGVELTLVNAWTFTTGKQGEYVERALVPPGGAGGYYWIACSRDACAPELNLDAPASPALVWQRLDLVEQGDPANRSVVDPVTAHRGITVREAPALTAAPLDRLPPAAPVTVLAGPQTVERVNWYFVRHEATGTQGWVDAAYLRPAPFSPACAYYDLAWVPARTPARSVMALLRPGQLRGDKGVETRTLPQLAADLRDLGLLATEERLVVVPLAAPYQGIEVRTAAGAPVGWIRIGGDPGSVRRIAFAAPERQVGPQCWLMTDYAWACE